MSIPAITLPAEAVTLRDGQAITTSLLVAEIFGKQHKDVLRALENLDCSAEFARRNFAPRSYIDSQQVQRRLMEMTRDGFTFLVMGFTGALAARFKEAYIAALPAKEVRSTRRASPR